MIGRRGWPRTRSHLGQRSGDTEEALVSLDADEVLLQPEKRGIDLYAVLEVVAATIFWVFLDRPVGGMIRIRADAGREP